MSKYSGTLYSRLYAVNILHHQCPDIEASPNSHLKSSVDVCTDDLPHTRGSYWEMVEKPSSRATNVLAAANRLKKDQLQARGRAQESPCSTHFGGVPGRRCQERGFRHPLILQTHPDEDPQALRSQLCITRFVIPGCDLFRRWLRHRKADPLVLSVRGNRKKPKVCTWSASGN